MFSAECVSVLLLCACAAATATINNSTPHLRTFVLFSSSVTDEPLNLDLLDLYDRTNESSRFRVNVTHHGHPQFSEEALLFLSGPVSTIFIPCFYTLVCVVSIPINVCAVLAFARGIRPKKPAAIYMLNLAMADLLFAMLLPFKIFYHFNGNNWSAFYWNMYCSVLLIACISVDRLLAVVYPIDSLTWRRPKHAVTACALMWTVSLAGSVPLVSSEQTTFLQQLNIITCHDVQHVENVAWLKVYFLFLCSALFFLPLLVTLTSYARVLWSLCRIPKGVAGSSRRRRRAVVMALTVLLIFLVCFMPTNVLLFVHYLLFSTSVETSRETPDGSYAAYLVFLCVGSLNCILDPLVYYFGSSQCQNNCPVCSRVRRTATGTKSATLRENLHSQYRKLLV
uniref:G-protein coupled receptors family 1 profile domain-containing protein n=1 Tax=Gouania willdenowi TaxID=441366 RepID=A0A8C5E9Y1_GOUWI